MDNLLQTIREERTRFGPTLSHDECARLCNAVAWRHRAQGFGLSAKTGGTYGTLPNGTRIAHDILHHQPSNELVDILTAAGAESVPHWAPVGPPQSADRVFVAPIDPMAWDAKPPAWSVPVAPAPVGPTLADLLTRLDTMREQIALLTHNSTSTAEGVQRLEAALKNGVPLTMNAKLIGRVTGTVGGSR